MRPYVYLTLALSLMSFGCGGSGGGGETTLPPTLPPIVAPDSAPTNVTVSVAGMKSLRVEWDAVNNADHYKVLADSRGTTNFLEVSTGAHVTTTSLTFPIGVHRLLWGSAQHIVDACSIDDSIRWSSTPVTLPAGLDQAAIGYFKASNTGTSDYFGYTVALSSDGQTMAVASYSEGSSATGINGDETDNSANGAGAVFIFVKVGGVWSQEAYIKASNTEAWDRFGQALALSDDGNTLAVSTISEASSATGINGDQTNNDAASSGAVYVYSRSGGTWSQQAYIKGSNTEAGDWFGQSVALSANGNTLAVGADGEDSNAVGVNGDETNNGRSNSGAVYVFTRSGTVWTQEAYVKASYSWTGVSFGYSVALSDDGNTLAVGARGESSSSTGINGDQANNGAIASGAAYILTRTGTSWSQQAYIKASNTQANDRFGASISLSSDGNTLAVGAIYEDSSATGINGDQSDNSVSSAGAAYVFVRAGLTWSQQAFVKASNPTVDDQFAYALALSGDGNTLIAGSPQESSSATGTNGNQMNEDTNNSGAVYVFSRSGTSWAQESYVKATNPGENDRFGQAAAINGDGNTLAVGSCYEDSSATGIGGNQASEGTVDAGAVYLY